MGKCADFGNIVLISSGLEGDVLADFLGSPESLLDTLFECNTSSARGEDEDDELAEPCSLGGEPASSGGDFTLLPADLKELFEILEFAEDLLEGGDRPLAKA